MTSSDRVPEDQGLLRALGLADAILLVIGTAIGSGVFLVSADIARAVRGARPLPPVWIADGNNVIEDRAWMARSARDLEPR